MKTGIRIVILAVVFVAVVTLATNVVKALQASKRVKPRILSFKPNFKISSLFDLSNLRTMPVTVRVGLDNFSSETFKLNQVYFELYDREGVTLLANQTLPLSSSIDLKPNATTEIDFQLEVNSGEGLRYFKDGVSLKDILSFTTGGQLGKKLLMKGFVVAEGLKADLNEIVEI